MAPAFGALAISALFAGFCPDCHTTPTNHTTMKLPSILIALLSVVSAGAALAAEPIKIGYSDWPGWTAWEIAKEKGLFKKAGVDVKLVWFPIYTDSLTALNTGKLDANCQTWSDTIPPLAEGIKLKVVLANDNSAGNDGFVSKKEFKSIKSLKGTVDHFLLLQALSKNGMTEKDIVFKNMTVPDAAAAFRQGKLDAAVIWQPSLNDVMKEGKANLLFTSKDVPGLIPDLLVFQDKVVKAREADIQKIVGVWFEVVDFIKKNEDEAVKIMAKVVEQKPEDYKAFLPGTKLFDLSANKKAFTKSDDVHSLYGSGKVIQDFLIATELQKKKADYEGALEPKFVIPVKK
jgi:NitT/TauT family transport system substrate-binding protein